MKRFLTGVAAAAALALSAVTAVAQDYPTKAISLVVPYAAGGPSDTIARLVANSMSETLGQQVLVENVSGAGGTLGAARVARSEPDGYTLLIHHLALAATASLYKNLTYDTATAFEPIGLVNYGPFLLTSRRDFEPKDAKELVAKLKADGDKITMAHAGEGSGSHLCGMMLTQALGTKVTYVPYKGTGPAMTDLVGGQVDVLCDQTTNAFPQIKGDKIKAFAVTAAKRLEQMPDLPTVAEVLGQKDFDVTVWHALYAPKGTPKPVIEKLHKALQVALADANVQKRFDDLGTLLFPEDQRSPEALGEKLESEVAHWAATVKAAGIQPK